LSADEQKKSKETFYRSQLSQPAGGTQALLVRADDSGEALNRELLGKRIRLNDLVNDPTKLVTVGAKEKKKASFEPNGKRKRRRSQLLESIWKPQTRC
jgi:hypothetical protein